MIIRDDEAGMRAALREAQASADADEVPIGCVVVQDGMIIGRGHNQTEALQDATAHAEILAIGAASNALRSWRLGDCTLYVTLEPCSMCAGPIVLSRLARLVYGAPDPQAGACGSVLDALHEPRLNHRAAISAAVMLSAGSAILRPDFQRQRREHGQPAES